MTSTAIEDPAASRPRATRVRLIIVLGAVNAIGPLSIDMYLPGFPAIASSLHASAAQVQLTLTACVAGLALGQLIVGPLSDRLGRRGAPIAAPAADAGPAGVGPGAPRGARALAPPPLRGVPAGRARPRHVRA